jgi:hypothetical protein
MKYMKKTFHVSDDLENKWLKFLQDDENIEFNFRPKNIHCSFQIKEKVIAFRHSPRPSPGKRH